MIIKHLDRLNTQLLKEYSEGIFLINCEGDIMFSNRAAFKLTGNEHKEKSQQLTALIHKSKQQQAQDRFQLALKGEKVQFSTIIHHKTKKELYLYITLIPIIVNEQVAGVYAVCRDDSKEQERSNHISQLETHLKMEQKLANVGSWYYDVMEDKSYWSPQLYNICGLNPNQHFTPSLKNVLQFVNRCDQKRLEKAVMEALSTGGSYTIEYTLLRPSGEERTVFEQADALVDEQGNVIQLIGVVHDITESKVITNELKQKEQQFQTIYNNLDAGIWSVDLQSNEMIFCSSGVSNIYGEDAAKLLGNRDLWKSFIHPEDKLAVEKGQHQLQKGKTIRQHYRIYTKTGEMKWIKDRCIPTLDENGNLVRIDGIVEDITAEKKYMNQVEYLATHDHVTNLANRRKFERELKNFIRQMKKNGDSLAVFYLGLNRFKHISDTLGHEVGDRLLQCIANRLKKFVTPRVMLARVGEDKLAVCFLSLAHINECQKLVAALFQEIEKEITVDDFSLYVTASIGVSIYPHDGEDVKTLLTNANLAMRRAKELGRSDWQLYSPLMDSETYKSYHLEKGLRNALLQNEFFIEYQPKVHTKSREIDSIEALIRWNHPEWGRVSPEDFIPLAEETHLIIEFGDWVIDHVCKQLQQWKSQSLQIVPVSINVSSKHLLKRGFVEHVQQTLARYNINPSFIEFEVTESSIIQHEEHVKKVMEKLKEIGVTFALDDFGTGFSSLSHLKDFEFNTLKIDKAFIQHATDKGKQQAITKGILYLAHALNMKVIAEGVETKEQLEFLQKHECSFIQGYIVSPPVAYKQIAKYLKKRFL
ncbi:MULTISPECIES: sensor domain-containing protein [Priestia]|uniref:sensor domain-containing protein n=1 Tax=Priestia TaxID=2800373 RepID=UPI002D7EE87F|nr:EAL domain-containing protein [Priestia megaterium]MEB4888162.1 EAL domain-containing protein [Priestia megaterium]